MNYMYLWKKTKQNKYVLSYLCPWEKKINQTCRFHDVPYIYRLPYTRSTRVGIIMRTDRIPREDIRYKHTEIPTSKRVLLGITSRPKYARIVIPIFGIRCCFYSLNWYFELWNVARASMTFIRLAGAFSRFFSRRFLWVTIYTWLLLLLLLPTGGFYFVLFSGVFFFTQIKCIIIVYFHGSDG